MTHCQDCINTLDVAHQLARAAVERSEELVKHCKQSNDAKAVELAEGEVRMIRESWAVILQRLRP